MNEAIKAIALSDDFSIVRSFEYFQSELTKSLPIPLSELQSSLKGPTSLALLDLLRENEDLALSSDSSVALARWALVEAAESGALAPFVTHCVQNWPDDRQSVGKILQLGGIGITWLIVATTEVTYRDGRLSIHKSGMSPTGIEASAATAKGKFELHIQDKKPASITAGTPATPP